MYGIPGPGRSIGGGYFFREKKGVETFFNEKGDGDFFQQKGSEDFFRKK